MSHAAVTPAPKILLDDEAIRRTLSRIAHEIIERNDELDGSRAGRHPHARRPACPATPRPDRGALRGDLDVGQLDITFHRDDVHVQAGKAPRRPQPLVRDTRSSSSSRAAP